MYTQVSPLIVCMAETARKAGRFLARDFNEIIRSKIGLLQFVVEAEKRADLYIKKDLLNYQGDYSVLSEESGFVQGDNANHTWIIDPLDGSTNFSQGLPFFSVSIALRYKNAIKAGVIYDPICDVLYFAERGKGAYMNNTRLRVPCKRKYGVAYCHPKNPYFPKVLASFKHVRFMGSTSLSLAHVAAGHIDFHIENDPRIWDVAAGIVIIQEAGGIIDDLRKTESVLTAKDIIASNCMLSEDLIAKLEKSTF